MTGSEMTPPTQHSFPSEDGLTIFGHLSVPMGPGPHPVVVIHTADRGGALDREGRYVQILEHAPLVAAGFAAFTVDQRGALGHGDDYRRLGIVGGGDVEDLIAGAQYVATLPGISRHRVGLMGTSRGGYAGLLALVRKPSLFRAAVLAMGFYDPMLYVRTEQRLRPTTSPVYKTAGSWELATAWFSDSARQPLRHLEAVRAPIYAIHGEADDKVEVEHARRLQMAAEESGLECRVDLIRDMNHDLGHAHPSWPMLWERITAHLRKHLGQEPAS